MVRLLDVVFREENQRFVIVCAFEYFENDLFGLVCRGVRFQNRIAYTHVFADPGHADAAAEVQRHAQARIAAMFDLLDAHLATAGGPWMLGERFSALDPYAFMLGRWTRGFTRERPAQLANLCMRSVLAP